MMWKLITILEDPMDRVFTLFPIFIYPWLVISLVGIPIVLITFHYWTWLGISYGIGVTLPISFIALSAFLAWKKGKLIDERKTK